MSGFLLWLKCIGCGKATKTVVAYCPVRFDFRRNMFAFDGFGGGFSHESGVVAECLIVALDRDVVATGASAQSDHADVAICIV